MTLQVSTAILPFLSYLVGAIPFSLILVRWAVGIDLRKYGSCNIGATNARRAAGTVIGVTALICDALKGALPTLIAVYLTTHAACSVFKGYAVVVAVAAIAGHMFPIYLKFAPSGKGVATTLGCFLVLAPLAVTLALLVFLIVVATFRHMSLGSLAAAVVLVPAVWVTSHDPVLLIGAIVIMALITVRHKDNIRRLRQGKEPKL